MVIKTNLIPRGFAAFSAWPFIFILPSQADNKQLIEHEKTHYQSQAWWTPSWFICYWTSKNFRWKEELAAHKKELELCGSLIYLSNSLLRYNTGRTLDNAMQALLH